MLYEKHQLLWVIFDIYASLGLGLRETSISPGLLCVLF